MKFMTKLFVGLIYGVFLAIFLTGCGGGGSGSGSSWWSTTKILTSIEISPAQPAIALGKKLQFTAIGVYSDGSTQDLTATVTWASANAAVATISNAAGSAGLATSIAVGTTTIKATFGTLAGSTVLTVAAKALESIDITPVQPSIAVGTSQQFTATGIYTDDTKEDITASVVWNSSSTGIATINSTGLATAVSKGPTTITATMGSIVGTTDLSVASLVSMYIDPGYSVIPKGLQQQLVAVGVLDDGGEQDLSAWAIWSSTDTNIADVSSAGLVTTISNGVVTINAAFGGLFPAASVEVTDEVLVSIAVTPVSPTIALNTSLQLSAIGTYSGGSIFDLTPLATWNSGTVSVADVGNDASTKGLVTSKAIGITSINASYDGVSGATGLTVSAATLKSITIIPANATISVGVSQQYTAIGNFSDKSTQDLTTQVLWRSSNKTKAVISNISGANGLLSPLSDGAISVSATFALGSYAILPVVGSTGLTIKSGVLQAISLTPNPASVNKGKTLQFTATATYSDSVTGTSYTQDLTKSVNLTWSSSDNTIATIVNVPKKNKGLAQGIKAGGSVTITAKLRRGAGVGTSGTAQFTVN